MQYRVAKLEKELDDLDQSYKRQSLQIHLTSFEGNSLDRDTKLAELNFALFEYDNLAQRTAWAMNMPDVEKRDLENARYWRTVTSVAKDEIEYTEGSTRDVMHIGVVRGRGMEKLKPLAKYLVETAHKLREKIRRVAKS
ncbi:hypothetical protein SLS56_009101 [Neofusicoccum ribis]|uniref:DUF6594 domain-containing protein n=1 Tax=Neofusicoccum ribis TaxID=45134 RepID=A0ABR3SJ08_9PEZI